IGIPVMLNPAPAAEIDLELLRGACYFTPNRSELEYYSGIRIKSLADARNAVKKLLSDGIRTVVATLGADGAVVGDADGIRMIPGCHVEAVDTVGAGDAFNGALAARLVMGEEIDKAVDYANIVGALSVTKHGAIPSIPKRNDVLAFLQYLQKEA
ncbi:MAG TPA: PfkB family carbohydrate kinase, partial [Clostridia bacterium]|nr:PfkB family carbohydrate kinase [Clostridia bacterium]